MNRTDLRQAPMIHHDENYFRQIEASPHRPSNTQRMYLYDQLNLAGEEPHRMDKDLAMLLANRSRVIRHINRCRTSLAPYSRLPTELIEEITQVHCSNITSPPFTLW